MTIDFNKKGFTRTLKNLSVSLQSKRGFTLIELLVVIAIIGILSSIVLASLNTARSRAKIAAAKSEMSSMRAEAEILYDSTNPNSYATVCSTTSDPYALYLAAAVSVGDTVVNCNSTGGIAWAASIDLNGTADTSASKEFCVDSTGTAAERTTLLGTTATVCPAS